MRLELRPQVVIQKLKDLYHRINVFDKAPIEDKRKQPQIPPVMIFKSLLFIPLLRIKSRLQLDSYLRLPEVKKLLGSKREMVVSDSTMERSLKGFNRDSLRTITHAELDYHKRNGNSRIELCSGRKIVAGIVDGTTIGKKLCSVFYVIGKINTLVDVEKIEKRGKELAASWKLLERNFSEADLFIFDGLYYVKEKINWLRKQGKHVLIKTEEEKLQVLQDAEGLFRSYEEFKDTVRYDEGVEVKDNGDKFSYKVWAAEGFRTDGIDYPLKIAKVQMENIATGTVEVFYVITTLEELTGLEMKQLAQWRWRIENNAFKKGNEHYALKHAFINDEHGWEAMTLILFIGFNLFEMLRKMVIEEGLVETVRRKSYKWFAEQIKRSILILYAVGGEFSFDSS